MWPTQLFNKHRIVIKESHFTIRKYDFNEFGQKLTEIRYFFSKGRNETLDCPLLSQHVVETKISHLMFQMFSINFISNKVESNKTEMFTKV